MPSGIRSLPFFALVVLGVQSAGLTAPLPDWLRFSLAIATLIWIPGILLERMIGPQLRWPALRLSLTFFLGASVSALIASVVIVFDGSFGLLRALLQILVGAFFVYAWIRSRNREATGKRPVGALVLLAVLAIMVSLSPVQFDFSEDAFDHIGYLRHIESENRLEPLGVLAYPAAAGDPAPDPRKGALHPVIAVVASVAGVDPLSVWALLPVIIFPLSFLAFIGFCRPFVERKWQLFGCALLFGLFYGGIGFKFAEASAYGQNLSVAWYWLITGVLLGVQKPTSKRVLGMIALLVCGGTLTHLGVALHTGILLAAMILFPGAFDFNRGSALRVVVVLGGVVVIAGVWKFLHTYAPGNTVHLHPQGLLLWGKTLVTASPIEIIRHHGMLFFGGLVALPTMLFFIGRRLARKHLALAVIPFAVSFVPWLATPLFHAGSYMVFRSLLGIPVFALILVLAGWIFAKARNGGLFAKAGIGVVAAVWALAFLSPTLRAVGLEATRKPSGQEFSQTHRNLIRYLNTLPETSVILSDPKTSYALSAMTPHQFVAIHGQHATPGDSLAMIRLRAVRDALSPYTMSEKAIEACDKFGVDFVVINGRTQTSASEFLSLWDRNFFALTVAKMIGISGRFRETYKEDGVVVFLYDSTGTGEIKWSPPMAPFDRAPGNAVRCVIDAPEREYSITSIAIEPDRLLPGEEITVTIGYEKYDASDFGFPTTIHLRFDHESISQDRGYPGEKHVRRYQEQRAGKRLRFRRDVTPYGGLFPVELWPIGANFYERIVVKVPPVMKLGKYRLEITLDRETLLPNLEVGDLLYNRDHFSGRTCAQFELVGSIVRRK